MYCDIHEMVETPQLENKIRPFPLRHTLEEQFGGVKGGRFNVLVGFLLLKLFKRCPYKSLLVLPSFNSGFLVVDLLRGLYAKVHCASFRASNCFINW